MPLRWRRQRAANVRRLLRQREASFEAQPLFTSWPTDSVPTVAAVFRLPRKLRATQHGNVWKKRISIAPCIGQHPRIAIPLFVRWLLRFDHSHRSSIWKYRYGPNCTCPIQQSRCWSPLLTFKTRSDETFRRPRPATVWIFGPECYTRL